MAALGVSKTESCDASGERQWESASRLLAATATGDRRAFSELFDLLHPVVRRTVYRVIRDPTLGQDVMQEVFLETWQTASRFDASRGNAFAWVCTIARRRAIDRVRAVQASRDRDRRIGIRDADDGYDSVWEHIEISSEHERALRAMSQITQLQRECVTLAYSDGFNYAEIADRLRVPVGTVKTRLRDGLTRLRAVMVAE